MVSGNLHAYSLCIMHVRVTNEAFWTSPFNSSAIAQCGSPRPSTAFFDRDLSSSLSIRNKTSRLKIPARYICPHVTSELVAADWIIRADSRSSNMRSGQLHFLGISRE